jgi:hypothetical protein
MAEPIRRFWPLSFDDSEACSEFVHTVKRAARSDDAEILEASGRRPVLLGRMMQAADEPERVYASEGLLELAHTLRIPTAPANDAVSVTDLPDGLVMFVGHPDDWREYENTHRHRREGD